MRVFTIFSSAILRLTSPSTIRNLKSRSKEEIMRRRNILTLLAIAIFCFASAQRASATDVQTYGNTSVDFDPDSGIVSGTTTTTDLYTMSYYQARVVASLTDQDGNLLASGSFTDTQDAGEASVTLQASGTVRNTYTLTGTHGLLIGFSTDPPYYDLMLRRISFRFCRF
jgi:hypothetical protein